MGRIRLPRHGSRGKQARWNRSLIHFREPVWAWIRAGHPDHMGPPRVAQARGRFLARVAQARGRFLARFAGAMGVGEPYESGRGFVLNCTSLETRRLDWGAEHGGKGRAYGFVLNCNAQVPWLQDRQSGIVHVYMYSAA